MSAETKDSTTKIDKWDYILIIGFILSPMTGLRIWKIGPAELCCFIWSMKYIKQFSIKKSDYLTSFWIQFIAVSFIGSVFGIIFYPKESSITGMFTWIYFMFISISICIGLSDHSLDSVMFIIKIVAIISPIWYFFIYLYGEYVSMSFLGAPIWFGEHSRFSGGGTNPHQVAMLLGVCIVLNLGSIVYLDDSRIIKIIRVICMSLAYYLSNLTESSTLQMALVVGIGVGFFSSLQFFVKNQRKRLCFMLILVCLIMIIVIVLSSKLRSFFYSWVSSDSNGLGRLTIYKTYPVTFFKNPIFGLGPGIHAIYGTMEYHNTYLEVLAMSGLLGFVVFIRFSVVLFSKMFKNPIWIMVVSLLYTYGLSGFGMRRLVYWLAISIIIVASNKTKTSDY